MADEIRTSPVAHSVEYGPANWSQTSTVEWRVHDFLNLPQESGEVVEGLPPLNWRGIPLRLKLFPRGPNPAVSGWVSASISVSRHSFIVAGCNTKWIKFRFVRPIATATTKPIKVHDLGRTGKTLFMRRKEALTYLVDGTLTIQAELQITEERTAPWTPPKTIGADMGKLLRSGEGADVTFVAGQTSFPAHRLILKLRAPTLYELCEDSPPGSAVSVEKVSPSAFGKLLEFVYTDEPPHSDELRRDALELLDAADRFGCTGLKLHAESQLVQSGMNSDNVVSMLLLADAKSCALLKETATNFIAANPSAAMASDDWEKVKESPALMAEIMEASFGKRSAATPSNQDEVEYDTMTVSTLRRKLDEAGLSGDGTREMLVKRLKSHHDTTDDSSAHSSS